MAAPPKPTRSQPPREQYRHGDLKRALIEAGTELARTGGPDAVILREVTRQAGVVPNAAYRHFANRDELLEAVRSAALSELAKAMEQEIATTCASLEDKSVLAIGQARLRAVGASYLRFARQQTGLFKTAFTSATGVREEDVDPDRAGPAGLNPFQLLGAALDDLARAGALSVERRQGAEYLAWSAVHGLAMLTIDGPMARLPDTEIAALGERLLDVVVRGL